MLKHYAQFSSAAIQMAIIILIGVYTGQYLDEKYKTDKQYFTMVLALVSVAIALYVVLKKVMKISAQIESERKADKQKEQE